MPSTLRIATWNINSVRMRLSLLARVVKTLQPDILCLQETKVEDTLFPHDKICTMGFPHQRVRGEKSYNGMAILSKYPIASSSHIAFCNKEDTRHLSARIELSDTTLNLHNLYVPAGGYKPDVDKSPKFAHKLAFVEEMSQHFSDADSEEPCVLLGDLNIAPLLPTMRSVEGMGGRIAWLSLMLPSSEGGVRSSGYFVMRGVVCFCLLALPYGRAAQRQTRFIYCVCFGWR